MTSLTVSNATTDRSLPLFAAPVEELRRRRKKASPSGSVEDWWEPVMSAPNAFNRPEMPALIPAGLETASRAVSA